MRRDIRSIADPVILSTETVRTGVAGRLLAAFEGSHQISEIVFQTLVETPIRGRVGPRLPLRGKLRQRLIEFPDILIALTRELLQRATLCLSEAAEVET